MMIYLSELAISLSFPPRAAAPRVRGGPANYVLRKRTINRGKSVFLILSINELIDKFVRNKLMILRVF